jgi:hypothetical protein
MVIVNLIILESYDIIDMVFVYNPYQILETFPYPFQKFPLVRRSVKSSLASTFETVIV